MKQRTVVNTIWKRDNFNDDRIFKKTETLTLKEILDHEQTYNFDINKDGSVGDVIAEVLTNDGNGHGLYKTVSGSYVIDDSGLSVGSATTDPTILITQKVVRGKTTSSNYEFTQTPTGIVFDSDGSSGIYYQDTKGDWFRESFSSTGVFTTQETYTLSQLFADESKYKNDLNNDGNIGDVITAVIGDNGSIGLYQTGSGSYLIDNSGLGIGDSSVSPTLLVSQKVSGRNITTSLYDFKNTPTGALSFKDGSGVGVYYQDSRGAWKRDNFNNDGVFQVTDSLTISEVLNDEAVYNLDLDDDGNIGDTVSAIYMNVPDADAAVENPKDNFGVYKTATGSYIADTADLAVGAYADDPTLLVKQTVSRGKTTTTLHNFKYTPTGAVAYAEGGGSVYYQDTKGKWFRDNFTDAGVFQQTNSLTLSEVQNEEGVHDLDLDGDGVVGDTIESVLANDGQGKAIFKTTTGSYIVDSSTLNVGDQTNDPTILIKATVSCAVGRPQAFINLALTHLAFSSLKTVVESAFTMQQHTAVKQHGNAIALIQMAYLSRRIR